MMQLNVQISPGELIDKITILQLKVAKIRGWPASPARRQLELLQVVRASLVESEELQALSARLEAVNATLWHLEDDIRACERSQSFGPRFIEVARAIYHTNDERSAIKRSIDQLFDSPLIEVKSYAADSPTT